MSRRSKAVGLGVTMIAASALSGCAGDNPDYSAICVNPQTHQRVSDRDCNRGNHPSDWNGVDSGFFWYYVGTHSGSRVPAIGQTYSGGTYNGSRLTSGSNSKTVQRGGVPKTGGSSYKSFTKSGGFGSSKGISSS